MRVSSSALLLRRQAPLTSPPTAANPRRAAEQYCLALLQACTSLPALFQIQAHLLKSGLRANPLVLTKFTSTCSSLGALLEPTRSLLFSPDAPVHLYDAFLFNTLIRACAESRHSKHDAVAYFCVMLHRGIPPNKFTFPFLLKACACLADARAGMQVHASAVNFGFDGDPYVMNTLIHMYASFGVDGLECARNVFDDLSQTSTVSWSAMIGGYVRSGLCNEAVALFRKMQIAGVRPDGVTLITVLSACADLGALELSKWIGSYIEREKVPKTLELCNALVNALAKCGDIDGAVNFFDQMPEKNIVSWTSVIDGLAMHGHGHEAIAVFERMKKVGVIPDDVTFVGVLSACSHAGMVDKGCRFFDSMKKDYNILPKIEHYGCMVDLFSRAGLVERALDFLRSMPIEPNAVIWRTLIGACRIHGRLELGESVTRQLIDKDPTHASNYVLLSNVYAMMKRWEKKFEIRNAMSKQGIRKVPGCSLLELGGEIYEFVSGDKSHSQYKEILEMVEEMGRKLKRAGYVPTTTEVLLDIDDEDKEDALHSHSEKLAIAFALLKTARKAPIRIVKNLRVCRDCHTATKLISKIYDREIVVRDRSRFHFFKDGLCSCKDFW
uniref:Pentatricopeptide repeat-containing protein At5g66520 n=1 Tax=Anthurium amnicola TaxID=1678845 RepID=A0A1D1ZIC0_9ARAE